MPRTLQRKKGEDRVPLNMQIRASVNTKLRDYVARDGVDTLTSVVERGIVRIVEDAPNPNLISFELPEKDRAALDGLAPQFFQDNATDLIKFLARAAASKGTAAIRELVESRADKSDVEKAVEENTARAAEIRKNKTKIAIEKAA